MLDFFDEDSPFLSHPLLTAERTAAEVDFVIAQLEVGAGDTVLDAGCGFGRHAVELARRGFAVTAVDPSPTMIAQGRQLAAEAGVDITFVTAPVEACRFKTTFDGVICLFTTLGQVGAAGENEALLEKLFETLKPDGRLVVEVPQRETAVAALRPEDHFGDTQIERSYDPESRRVTERFVVQDGTQARRFLLQYRLYSAVELVEILTAVGFQIVARFGSYAGEALRPSSPVMIVVATKPDGN